MIPNEIRDWLLEENNPAVRLRTLTGLCGYPDNDPEVREARQRVKETLSAAVDLSWMDLDGQTLVYHLTALAEAGLVRDDLPVEPVISRLLSQPFDANCADLMALRAMVMLGYGNDERLTKRLGLMNAARLPDGGWLCLHRREKMDRVPKSCIKVTMHGLLLAAELKRCGIDNPFNKQLVHYFLMRRLFYRMDKPDQLVLSQPGRRMIDVFFPQEYFHVGLPVLVEALSVLGVGDAVELGEAWSLLEEKKDKEGKIPLEGTLPGIRAYLPKERIGRPSKWGTFYAYSAWKNRD